MLLLLAASCSRTGAPHDRRATTAGGGGRASKAAAAADSGGANAGTDGVPGADAGVARSAGGEGGALAAGGMDTSAAAGMSAATDAGAGARGDAAEAESGAAVLAFPGAEGFGKNATGGRNGAVYHVTNLNDSGAGSFRDAVSAPNRFVVFDVGGYIRLTTAVSVESDITIAGQTAPGGGIGLRGGELSFASSSNIIMRHVRVRPGSDTASTEDDALSLYRARNVMIDHSSFAFGPWNDIDGVSDDWQNHPVTDITIQDSLIADPTEQQFGAHTESVSGRWAWYRNIFANSHNRNPLAKIDTVFVNNVLYNDSAGYTTHTSTSFNHDIVNNYFVFGPASAGTDNTWYQVDKNQAIYYAGNLKDTNQNGTLDGAETTPSWYQGPGTILMNPWSSETGGMRLLDAASAARAAISLTGAWPRDQVDGLIVSQVMTLGKGTMGFGAGTVGPDGSLYTSQAQTGLANNGYGEIAAGDPLADADHDGMPDDWERATESDPSVDDAMTKAADGYTLLEHYVNWLAVLHATSSGGAAIAFDLSQHTLGFSAVSPTFAVMTALHGSVSLDADGHTARFRPSTGFHGLASFRFTVSGSDGSGYAAQVEVLAQH
jgi:pectate lyase